MTCTEPAATRPHLGRPSRPSSWPSTRSSRPSPGITVYGCDVEEAVLFRHLAPRHGVLATIVPAALSEANADLARGDRCVSIGHRTRVTSGALRALRRAGVEHLSSRSVGLDHVDVVHAARLGIRVEGVAYSPHSVADYTLMLVLMALRDARSVLRRADSHDFRLGAPGRELRDLTVGVVGTGRIGTAVVERLRGFGCRVLAHDERRPPADDRLEDVERVSLDELLAASDVVTLHVPLTPRTHHLLDRQRLGRLKPGAIVVNTARGALIDTEALLSALEGGALGGAALDVLEGEEGTFYTDCRGGGRSAGGTLERLQRLPNVLVSPHTAYYTEPALTDLVEGTLLRCLAFEREAS